MWLTSLLIYLEKFWWFSCCFSFAYSLYSRRTAVFNRDKKPNTTIDWSNRFSSLVWKSLNKCKIRVNYFNFYNINLFLEHVVSVIWASFMLSIQRLANSVAQVDIISVSCVYIIDSLLNVGRLCFRRGIPSPATQTWHNEILCNQSARAWCLAPQVIKLVL